MSKFFYKKSSWFVVLLSTVLSFGYLFLVMVPKAKGFEIPSNDLSLGTSFGFTFDQVREYFQIRTQDMVIQFKAFNTLWDNIFPILHGLMYITWISFLFRPFREKVSYLNLLPLLQVIFDWLENMGIVKICNTWIPEEIISDFDVSLASYFSVAKWMGSSIIFFVILVGIGFRTVHYFKMKKNDVPLIN